jgi:CheY-like chemotaxis protein
MSEAIWIELIKVLPAFLWVGFGFIALAIARRIFTAQAPRMTKVETPWVTVELAQQAIEQASARGPMQVPALEPDWSQLYPPIPAQQAGNVFGQPAAPGGGTVPPPIHHQPVPFGDAPGSPVDAEQQSDLDSKSPNTPPADEPGDNALPNGGKTTDDVPPSPVTEPNRQVPNVPPTYPVIVAPPGGYYAPPPARPTSYAASAPLPPYGQPPAYQQAPVYGRPAYQPAPADSQRSLRAATRLAFSADRLEGGAILWVDDHPENNESLAQLFRTVGVQVDTVLTTEAAMQALQHGAYDLVISDVGRANEPAGRRAGLELLDRMKRTDLPTPVVFYTSPVAASGITHPRLAAATAEAEDLVNLMVDFVGLRSKGPNGKGTSWLDRRRS